MTRGWRTPTVRWNVYYHSAPQYVTMGDIIVITLVRHLDISSASDVQAFSWGDHDHVNRCDTLWHLIIQSQEWPRTSFIRFLVQDTEKHKHMLSRCQQVQSIRNPSFRSSIEYCMHSIVCILLYAFSKVLKVLDCSAVLGSVQLSWAQTVTSIATHDRGPICRPVSRISSI